MTAHFLEPGIDQLVQGFIESGRHCMSRLSIDARRKGYIQSAELAGAIPEIWQQSSAMAGSIPLTLFRPSEASALKVLVYFHGGCFVSGGLETHRQQLIEIANQSNALVVLVHYRLAPEFAFPAAHDDALEACEYIFQHCANWGGDPEQVVLAGDSAGGNLALHCSFQLRDHQQYRTKKQILIYPMLDASGSCDSYQRNGDDYLITRDALLSGYQQYLNNSGADVTDLRISPLLRDDLAGLPETHILSAEYDPLVDENELFYRELLAQDVPAQCRRYSGVIHGFFQLSGISQAARESLAHIAAIIKQG